MPQTVSEWNVLNYSADFPGSKVGRVTGIPSSAFRNAASTLRNLHLQLMNSSSQISISSIFDLFSSRVSFRGLNKLVTLKINSFRFIEIKLCAKILQVYYHVLHFIMKTQTLEMIIEKLIVLYFETKEQVKILENRSLFQS